MSQKVSNIRQRIGDTYNYNQSGTSNVIYFNATKLIKKGSFLVAMARCEGSMSTDYILDNNGGKWKGTYFANGSDGDGNYTTVFLYWSWNHPGGNNSIYLYLTDTCAQGSSCVVELSGGDGDNPFFDIKTVQGETSVPASYIRAPVNSDSFGVISKVTSSGTRTVATDVEQLHTTTYSTFTRKIMREGSSYHSSKLTQGSASTGGLASMIVSFSPPNIISPVSRRWSLSGGGGGVTATSSLALRRSFPHSIFNF